MTTIKITQLTDIGANLASTTVLPVVNMTGTPTTEKTVLGNIANVVLAGAGGNYVAAAKATTATTANTVLTAAQPNITSTGNLTGLTVSNATGVVNFSNTANVTLGAVGNLHISGGTANYVLKTDGAGNLSWVAQSGGSNGVPGGSNTQVQFNDAGAFAGNTGFTFDKTTGILTSPFVAGNGNGLSNIQGANISGAVTYAGTANSVAVANVSGIGNIATLSLTGSNSNVLYGNGVFAPASGGGNANTGNITFNGDEISSTNDIVNINASNYAQIQSGDSYVWAEANYVAIQANGYQWTFNNNAVLELANGANISQTTDGNGNQTFNITPSETSDFEVLVVDGNARIQTDAGSWTFDKTGNLNTPGNIVGPANANITIYANAGVHEFIFGDDGTFYAPDNVVLGGNSIYIGPGANTLNGIEHEVFIASSNLFPYVQAVVNNISDNGSADWVALGARGGDTGGQASLGFTSSGFGDANYTITGNGDGYVLVQSYAPGQTLLGGGGNLVLATGNQGSVKDIIFGTGGFLTANTFGRISHSNNSLELTRTGASLTFPDGSIQTTAYTGGGGSTGNVTFDDVTIQGVNGLNLSAGSDFTANLAYLQVRAGDVISHIHLDTGNNQAYDLIVGDDQKYVQVSSTGNILLSSYDSNTAQYTWTLDYNGNLILAGGNSVIQSIANSSLDPTLPNVSTMVLTPDPGYSSQSLVLDPTAPGHIHLRATASSNIDEPNANLFLGGEDTAFEITQGANNQAVIHSGGYDWTFGNDGTLTVPYEGVIQSFDDTIVLQSVDTGTGNSSSVRLATDGSLYFGGTEYLNGWFQIVNDSGDANIVSPSGNISITPAFGVANAAGKSLTLQGGDADQSDFYTGTGGSVNITGGLGSSDDGGGGGPGGNVNIASGLSADPAGHAGNINITAGSNDWVFDYNGTLTLPGNLVYIGASPAPSISGFNSVSAEQFTNDTSNVTINANSNTWNFDSTGNLTIPSTSGGFIKTASNASIGIVAMDNGTNNPAQLLSMNVGNGNATSIVSAYSTNVAIQTNASGAINTWQFDNAGNLTLPANTFAINYANGTQVSFTGSNISNGNSTVNIATAAGNIVANVNGSTVFTAYSGGIKVGGSGILQSPGGAGAITLNNNGANIPTANITTALNVTGASGANITANLTAGNISTGGVVFATGNVSGNFFLGNGSQLTGITVTSLVNGTSNVVVASSGNVTVGVAGTANVITATSTGTNVTGTLNATGDVTAQGTGSNIVRRAFGLVASDTYVQLDDLKARVTSSTSQLSLLLASGTWQGTGWTETFAGGGTPTVNNWVNLPLSSGFDSASGSMAGQGNGCRCIISDQTPNAKVYQITVVRSGTTGSQWNISIERLV